MLLYLCADFESPCTDARAAPTRSSRPCTKRRQRRRSCRALVCDQCSASGPQATQAVRPQAARTEGGRISRSTKSEGPASVTAWLLGMVRMAWKCQRIWVVSLSFGANPPIGSSRGDGGFDLDASVRVRGAGGRRHRRTRSLRLGRPIRSPRDETCEPSSHTKHSHRHTRRHSRRHTGICAQAHSAYGICAQAHSAYTFGSASTSMCARWSASTATHR